MAVNSIRAFSDPKYDYYELTKDFGILKAGTIFYHDPEDTVYGSIAEGCLKNCWTPSGGIFRGLFGHDIVGGSVILHFAFAKTSWFRKLKPKDRLKNTVRKLEEGNYTLKVSKDGSWKIFTNGRDAV